MIDSKQKETLVLGCEKSGGLRFGRSQQEEFSGLEKEEGQDNRI